MDDSGFQAYQARLFEAATGQGNFRDVMGDLAARFSASDGLTFELNHTTGEIQNWTASSLPIHENSGYSAHINAINPRVRFGLAHAPGVPVYEGRFISENQIARSEFYDWLKRSYEMKFFLGSRLYAEGDISVMHSVEFSNNRGHPEPEQIAEFMRTSRALGEAWRLARRRAQTSTDHYWAPNHLPYAIFALDRVGQVIEANDAAQARLAQASLLRIEGRRLMPVLHAMQGQFQAALGGCLRGARAEMLLQGLPGAGEVILQFIPVPPHPCQGPSDVVALLYLWAPAAPYDDRIDTARRLWGLSAAETRLVAQLAEGANLETAAETLAITRNTARNHLTRIFAKTGTARQSELMRMLQALLPGA